MNKLKALLLTAAMIVGCASFAAAEEHHDRDGWRHENRYNDHDRDDSYRYRNNGYYNNGYYGNGYYNNGYYNNGYYGPYYGNGYYGNRAYENHRWRDRDDHWRHRRDWDHDGDRD
jgi:hypothetical protein